MTGSVTMKEVMNQFKSRRNIAEAYVSMAGALKHYKKESHDFYLAIGEYEVITGIRYKDLYNWRGGE